MKNNLEAKLDMKIYEKISFCDNLLISVPPSYFTPPLPAHNAHF
jgi:hypothetical protein